MGLLPSYMGRARHDELGALQSVIGHTLRSCTAIFGGANISSKLDVLDRLSMKVDDLIIRGRWRTPFLRRSTDRSAGPWPSGTLRMQCGEF
jgi:phosphoglycerate kinase